MAVRSRFATFSGDAMVLALFLAFALAICAPVLTGKVPMATDTLELWGPLAKTPPQPAHNPVLADAALEYLPDQVFIRRSLQGGEWPLWNPLVFSGYPFGAEFQAQLYYPVAWVLWLFPLPIAFSLNAVLHIWLAATGMYLLTRAFGASRTGAALAGLAFGGSGQIYTALELPGVSNVYVWLPWVLWAYERAWGRCSWAWTALAGLLLAALCVAGNAQWVLYSLLFMLAWALARIVALAWDERRAGRSGGRVLGVALRSACVFAWGVGGAAVLIIPFVELAGLSSRVGAALPPGGGLSQAINQLLLLFVPRFAGSSVDEIGAQLSFNNCWYIGLPALALGGAALTLAPTRRNLFLGAAGLLALGVGAQFPVLEALHRLPGLQAQLPQRAAFIFIFAFAALSALGFDAFVKACNDRPRVARGVVAALALLGAAVAIALWRGHALSSADKPLHTLQAEALRVAGAVGLLLLIVLAATLFARSRRALGLVGTALVALTLVDLLLYAPDYNTYVRPESLSPRSLIVEEIQEEPHEWRLIAPDAPGATFVPNTSVLFNAPYVGGYLSLQLSRYRDFWLAADPHITRNVYLDTMLRPQSFSTGQARLLNARYVATISQLGKAGHRKMDAAIRLGGRAIGQSIEAPARLESIRVAFKPQEGTGPPPAVRLALSRAGRPEGPIAEVSGSPEPADGTLWMSFYLPPLDNPDREKMVFTLHGDEEAAVMVSSDSRYGGGELLIEGSPAPGDIAFLARGRLEDGLTPVYEEHGGLYRYDHALPRAFLVNGARQHDPAEIPALLAGGYEPRAGVLLEETPPAGWEVGTPQAEAGTAAIVTYRNLEVVVRVSALSRCWLVLGDVNYPGWHAEADGRAAPIYTAYSVVRAVPLEPGEHLVRFSFRPTTVFIGGAISLAALLSALGVLIVSRSGFGRRGARPRAHL